MNPSDNSNPGDLPSCPIITVATVTYNAEATLAATLRSVASQDYPRIEHLIIDGCSKDNTLSLVHRYVEQNTNSGHPHNIKLSCEPDEGLYDAMNKAIRQAGGDYIVFLNAGDCFHNTDTIRSLVQKIEWEPGDSSNPAVLYGETDLVDAKGSFLRHRRLTIPEKLTWRSFQSGMRVCHQSFYVRTDLAREIPYDLKYRFSADFDWCIRIMQRAEKRRLQLVNTGLILTDYLSEGMTTAHQKKSLVERLHIMAHYYGWPATLALHCWFVVRAVLKK